MATKYFIEGKKVSKLEYEDFLLTLTNIEGTYHCAKTIGGGRNSYDAKDPSGAIWRCNRSSKNDNKYYECQRK